jgi:predicted dehydrogenase
LVADFSIPLADADSHRWLNPAQGGGALLDRGVYAISLAIRLFGKPRTVTAVGQLAATGADRTVAIQMTFADARCAMLTASLCTYAGNDATVSGSRGRLRLCEPFYRPERVTLSRAPASQGGRSSDLSPQSVGAKIRGMASRIKAYLPSDIQRSTTLCFPIQGYGYTYEAREVVRCLQEGLTESPVMPLHDTMQVMETVGQIQEELRR